MALIKFERLTAPTGSVNFTRNPSYGSGDPFEYKQPKDLSDGGDLYSYDKGIVEDTIELIFNSMPETDYQNMIAFFKTVVEGAKYNFTYTDENGSTHTCRLMTGKIDFPKIRHDRRSGRIVLRKE